MAARPPYIRDYTEVFFEFSEHWTINRGRIIAIEYRVILFPIVFHAFFRSAKAASTSIHIGGGFSFFGSTKTIQYNYLRNVGYIA